MILDKNIKQIWRNDNKKYYLNRGYIFTKTYDIFFVKINDLSKGSNCLISVVCDVCGKEKKLSYKAYNYNIKRGDYYCCSEKCSMDKKRKNNLKKYGIEYPQKLNHVKEKMKSTNMKKYGSESPIGNDSVKNKTEQTNLKRHGVKYPMQNKGILKKMLNTVIQNYGEVWLKHVPSYNLNSIIYLDIISQKINLFIQHALNGGEKKFIRYWVDGYIEQYNIVLEWDEQQHETKRNIERDIKREKFLKENFQCYIIRINEREFLLDVNNQINGVINKINNIIKNG